MAFEIERKYIVRDESFKALAQEATPMVQGYLSRNPEATVRIRIAGTKAWLTVKSKNHGAVRHEWEYEVPAEDARQMLQLCQGVIEKVRYKVPYAQYLWEVDVFMGRHTGLVLAEVELPEADAEAELPPFVGPEVTGDPRYYNSNLSNAQ